MSRGQLQLQLLRNGSQGSINNYWQLSAGATATTATGRITLPTSNFIKTKDLSNELWQQLINTKERERESERCELNLNTLTTQLHTRTPFPSPLAGCVVNVKLKKPLKVFELKKKLLTDILMMIMMMPLTSVAVAAAVAAVATASVARHKNGQRKNPFWAAAGREETIIAASCCWAA